jgi:hypothetical protein
MPYHPGHRRVAPWQVVALALAAALFLAVYAWSFRAGRARALEPPPPAIPSAGGALHAPAAPNAPAPSPPGGPRLERR